jgi:hypothetical protein
MAVCCPLGVPLELPALPVTRSSANTAAMPRRIGRMVAATTQTSDFDFDTQRKLIEVASMDCADDCDSVCCQKSYLRMLKSSTHGLLPFSEIIR